MRTVFSNQELVHVWASGSVPSGRGNSMFFEKFQRGSISSAIYSYGRHFPLGARFEVDGTGPVIVINSSESSVTTSKHRSQLRRACEHLEVIEVEDYPILEAPTSKDRIEEQVANLLDRASRCRSAHRLDHLLDEAKTKALHWNRFVALWDREDLAVAVPNEANDAEYKEVTAKVNKLWAEQREQVRQAEAERARRRAEYLLKQRALLDEWATQSGDGRINGAFHDLPVRLRLIEEGKVIETSHGAKVPTAVAKRLWPLIREAEETGVPFYPQGTPMSVGHYTLRQINGDGTLIVGCHQIPFDELKKLATVLGMGLGTLQAEA